MEEVIIMKVPVIAETVTVTARIVEVMTVVEIAGHVAVILLFICLGLIHKAMKERHGFALYLFSLWGLFRREIGRGNLRSPLDAFHLLTDGDPSEEIALKAGEGRKYLLPKRRREILDEIWGLQHIRKTGFKAGIVLDKTAVHFSFYAGKEELDKEPEEWEKLGNLIEKENGALFIDDYWDDEKHLHMFEIVFSDEGRAAKSKIVPHNPRKENEAAKWFWWAVFPIFLLSLFIVHWAIWAIILVAAFFLYISDLEEKKQIRHAIKNERIFRAKNNLVKPK